MEHQLIPFILFFIVAFLYSSVGQAGGSSYVGLLLIMGFASSETKITSLAMNIIVSLLASFIFSRFSIQKIKPALFLLTGAIPFALLTGGIILDENVYRWVSVFFLLLSAVLLHVKLAKRTATAKNDPWKFLLTGICIGSVAGLTGIGGGILLSPVLLTLGWLDIKSAAVTTSIYNLVVSLTAFGGYALKLGVIFPPMAVYWFFAVATGGVAGAFIGKKYLSATALTWILTTLLLVAAVLIMMR